MNALKLNRPIRLALCLTALLCVTGCAGALGDTGSTSEIVRGCSYIACAIVTHGVISLFR